MEKNNLPQGWAEIEFKKIVNNIPLTGKKLKQKEYSKTGKLPVIDQGQDFVGGFTNKTELKANCNLPVIIFGDHTKIIKFVNREFVAGADGVKVLEPKNPLISKLIYYFVQAITIPNKGYARHYQFLAKSIIRIPPLNEQKKIVEKIEKFLSDVDNIKNILDELNIKIESLRISFVRWVFFGDFKKINYSSSKWETRKINDFFDIVGGGTPSTKNLNYWNGKIPWITSADIYGIRDIKSRRTVSELGIEHSATHVIPKNSILVVTRVGLGKLAILETPTCINQDIQGLISKIDNIYPPYALHYLSETIQIFKFQNRGTTISGVTKKQLSELPFVWSPMDEQIEISNFIDSQLSFLSKLKENNELLILLTKHLKLMILQHAFEGKLIPQDPNDESASELLKRIK